LLHSSEYSWNDSEAALKKEVKEGQKIKVKIINVDKVKNRFIS